MSYLGDRALAEFAWPMLWQSTLLIVVVAMIDAALRRKVSATARHALWILVLVKLLLPPSLAFPTGLAWWWPQRSLPAASANAVSSGAPLVQGETADTLSAANPDSGSGQLAAATFSYKQWVFALLLFLWLSGAVLLACWILHRGRWVRKWRLQADPASPQVQGYANDLAAMIGLRRQVPVLITTEFQSPLVCGCLQPFILVPQAALERLSEDGLRAVLLHELVHVKRGDVGLNCLQAVLQVVWWFNPILWLANARFRAVREEAVDERVMYELTRKQVDPTAYPSALVTVARLGLAREAFGLAFVGILGRRSTLQGRVRRLLSASGDWVPARRWSLFLSVGMLGLFLLPMGCGSKKEATAINLQREVADNSGDFQDQRLVGVKKLMRPLPGGDEVTNLLTRIYSTEPRSFIAGLEAVMGPLQIVTPAGETNAARLINFRLRQLLIEAGVPFATVVTNQDQERRSVFYNDRTGKMFVRATEEEQAVVEKLLQAFAIAPVQVQIDVKIVELKKQAGAAELHFTEGGVEILLPGTSNAIISSATLKTVLSTLEQTDGVDILSTPRVLTSGGNAASVSATQVAQLVNPVRKEIQATTLGNTVELHPEVSADGGSIHLRVKAMYDALNDSPEIPQTTDMVQHWEQSADAILRDGQTVVLVLGQAGTVTTSAVPILEDIPLLGRLFRTTNKILSKNRIVAFVTPRIVDPAGRPVNE
ncbi:MAG TPA: M56 family metallopeptidase [Candidatus Limnocylindria bacterium]|jgi:beta-lactamase regulating signal transducer with metallopeptidase domain|nr:M56 family metallopeptidase [Candidatus Limnocylindria bacterium]